MKKILFLIVSTILAGQVLAQGYDIKSKKLYYKIIDQNTVQLVGNNTYKELISVIIPETVKNTRLLELLMVRLKIAINYNPFLFRFR